MDGLTPAQRDEGRRIWNEFLHLSGDDAPRDLDEYIRILKAWGDFARKHMNALLAEPPDPEAIARAAVREFAEALSQSLMISSRVRGVELNTNQ